MNAEQTQLWATNLFLDQGLPDKLTMVHDCIYFDDDLVAIDTTAFQRAALWDQYKQMHNLIKSLGI